MDWLVPPAQPERSAHRPVRGGIAVVDHQALSGGFERPVDFRLARRPALERVLEMREGQAGMGARERRIEAHRLSKKCRARSLSGLVEPVHVPQAAMMRFPRIERVRRPQDGAVALAGLDLAGDGRDDPVADLVEDQERIVELVLEGFGPDDARGSRLGQFHHHGQSAALAPHDPLTT